MPFMRDCMRRGRTAWRLADRRVIQGDATGTADAYTGRRRMTGQRNEIRMTRRRGSLSYFKISAGDDPQRPLLVTAIRMRMFDIFCVFSAARRDPGAQEPGSASRRTSEVASTARACPAITR